MTNLVYAAAASLFPAGIPSPAATVGRTSSTVFSGFHCPSMNFSLGSNRHVGLDHWLFARSLRSPGFVTKRQHTPGVAYATAATDKSIHDFTVKDIDGKDISLSKFKGKVLLIVNVASKCGLTTANYTELSHLYEKYKNQGFEILAFPCNQFGGQEPGSNPEIKQFACTRFKAEFPIFDKKDIKKLLAA
ncbi:hypothetical protein HPP92_017466 [Vanilla planifolia]|uniref:Glutathione peroxidase n=1 Tax=Vanilla planifolia TaxID=51239 RepID=A0A835QCV1_VANPL|nr:hypothetical protein HPP92_017466 [Vanilla planifolia]